MSSKIQWGNYIIYHMFIGIHGNKPKQKKVQTDIKILWLSVTCALCGFEQILYHNKDKISNISLNKKVSVIYINFFLQVSNKDFRYKDFINLQQF